MKSEYLPAVRDTLQYAKARIARSDNWTQGALARNADGDVCVPHNPGAARWCAEGALHLAAALTHDDTEIRLSALFALFGVCPDGGWTVSVAQFNDDPDTRHEDVLSLYDRAIAQVDQRIMDEGNPQ